VRVSKSGFAGRVRVACEGSERAKTRAGAGSSPELPPFADRMPDGRSKGGDFVAPLLKLPIRSLKYKCGIVGFLIINVLQDCDCNYVLGSDATRAKYFRGKKTEPLPPGTPGREVGSSQGGGTHRRRASHRVVEAILRPQTRTAVSGFRVSAPTRGKV
jgi:hypothetical protein